MDYVESYSTYIFYFITEVSPIKNATKTGCALCFLALMLNVLALFFPETLLGQFSVITPPVQENISSFAEHTVSYKDSEIIRKIDDFVSVFLPGNNTPPANAPGSRIHQGEFSSNIDVHFLDVGQGLSIMDTHIPKPWKNSSLWKQTFSARICREPLPVLLPGMVWNGLKNPAIITRQENRKRPLRT